MISFEVNECNVIPFFKTAAPGQVLTNCRQRAMSPLDISRSLNDVFFKEEKNGPYQIPETKFSFKVFKWPVAAKV